MAEKSESGPVAEDTGEKQHPARSAPAAELPLAEQKTVFASETVVMRVCHGRSLVIEASRKVGPGAIVTLARHEAALLHRRGFVEPADQPVTPEKEPGASSAEGLQIKTAQ